MNDTLDILMFFFWKRTKSVQTVSKTVWNCNRDNITYCPRPGLWSKASCLDLANASPTHRPFLGSSETPKWWTQQTPRKHRLMQLMCRRLSSWQVYLHACLWVKVHRPNPQTGTQIAYSIQVFFHILPFVMAKPPWPSPELPHYQNLPIPALQSAGSSPTALEISCRTAESVRKCCGTGHPKFWPTLQCADQTKQVDVAG